MGVFRN